MDPHFINGGASDVDFQELLQAQAHIWNHTFKFINSISLKCAIELGIPDIICSHGKPITLSELVASLGIPSSKTEYVYRLMRLLTHSGFFGVEEVGDCRKGYVLTQSSRLLLKSNPFNVSPFTLMILDPVICKPWECLSSWFLSDGNENAFGMAHGKSLWEYAACEPRLNRVFNDAVASDCLLVFAAVMGRCKEVFDGVNSIVDVGGGTGIFAAAMARAFPEMDCTVFDLPHVVGEMQGKGYDKNLKFIGGNMFQAIPSSDAILFKWIMHDWSDKECVKILERSKEAIKSRERGGKVLIIDMVMDPRLIDATKLETQMMFDLEMMVDVVGQERNEKEWSKLFSDAGFNKYIIYPVVGLRSLIEVYV